MAKSRSAARAIDPTPYLEGRGFTVRREGRHRSVRDAAGDEVYRLTQPAGGRPWLFVDAYGQSGGDNIDLVKTIEPGTGFAEAVFRLCGEPHATPQPPRPAPKREPPRLPKQATADREAGRAYLWARGISGETMDAAERAGMLRYGPGAVLFCGRDPEGRAQNVTRRAIEADAKTPKRDLRGSAKEYAAILPGGDTVAIVEGGTDALALQDMSRLRNETPPTVIVSGGAQVRSWIDRCAELLRSAKRIILAGENEKDANAQERADAGHARQAEQIEALTGRPVERWTPAPPDKDIAALHARQVAEAEARQAAHEAEQRAAAERRQAAHQVEDPDEPGDALPRPGG